MQRDAQARQLTPMPAATHETLIGLLAATGLRVGEAIRLDRADIDWTDGVLAIRESKFSKTRMVPVLDSTLGMLDRYARIRSRLCPQPGTASFLVSTAGTRLIYAASNESSTPAFYHTRNRITSAIRVHQDFPANPRWFTGPPGKVIRNEGDRAADRRWVMRVPG